MNRYCTNCRREFDFKITSMEQMDNLVCPVCGGKIDKNSRKPRDVETENRIEEAIGEGFYNAFRFAYYFYLICGLIGVAAFFLEWYGILYVLTGISLITVFVRFVGTAGRRPFFLLLILTCGGIGYYLYGTIQGICLGVMVALIIGHIFKTVILRLFFGFINWCNRL